MSARNSGVQGTKNLPSVREKKTNGRNRLKMMTMSSNDNAASNTSSIDQSPWRKILNPTSNAISAISNGVNTANESAARERLTFNFGSTSCSKLSMLS